MTGDKRERGKEGQEGGREEDMVEIERDGRSGEKDRREKRD